MLGLPSLWCLSLLLGAAARPAPARPVAAEPVAQAPAPIVQETQTWHDKRVSRLMAEDGWLSLVGLHWLQVGDNTVGSDVASAVRLPASAPRQVGSLMLSKEGKVSFEVASGVALLRQGEPFAGGKVLTDALGEPDVFRLGTVRFMVIRRGARTAVRVKDSEAETRKRFRGIPRYVPRAAWRVDAHFEPSVSPRRILVPNILGETEDMMYPGALTFTLDGKKYRLDPVIEEGENQLFIIFGDETNHTDTYHSGRFLSAAMPVNGHVILDFNRAYNPPCAFTAYATCPLPPPQNRMETRVEAGEKRYPAR